MDQYDGRTFAVKMQRLLYTLIRNYELCDQRCMAQYGVTAAQGYALLALPTESSVSMNELSEAMGLASSTMTRTVDQLVQKELVHRRHDDEDRRVVRITLTARGRQVRRTVEEAMEAFFNQALADIPAAERSNILDSLETVTRLIGKALSTGCG